MTSSIEDGIVNCSKDPRFRKQHFSPHCNLSNYFPLENGKKVLFTSVPRYFRDNEALKVNTDPDLCKEKAPRLCFHNAIHVASYREGEQSREGGRVGWGSSQREVVFSKEAGIA